MLVIKYPPKYLYIISGPRYWMSSSRHISVPVLPLFAPAGILYRQRLELSFFIPPGSLFLVIVLVTRNLPLQVN